ncbi:MAG: hypothetical protein WA459_00215 [Stellaceae bacterium]
MSLKGAGDVAGKVLEKIQGRGPISRWARRMQKHSRQNWRRNGLRPRGRGYDWARTLIAEKILELATLSELDGSEALATQGELEEKRAAASVAVEVKMAELAAAVGCHVRIARREVARLESMGCLRRAERAGGRGRATVLHVYHTALASRVLGRLHRFEGAKTGRGPQLSLPLKRTVEVPAEIQATIDRMAAIAAARGRSEGAKPVDNSVQKNLVGNSDPSSSHTLHQPRRTSPSALAGASGEGGLRRREIKFAKIVQRPDLQTLHRDWRECDLLDRSSKETLSEPLRRRLNRHLRLCCWYRGLGLVETRRVTGAVGWTAASIGKASKRKYLLIDAIGWVMASKPDALRQATASWTRTLGRVRSGFEHGPGSQVKKSI